MDYIGAVKNNDTAHWELPLDNLWIIVKWERKGQSSVEKCCHLCGRKKFINIYFLDYL
jgi:hypothetical protein